MPNILIPSVVVIVAFCNDLVRPGSSFSNKKIATKSRPLVVSAAFVTKPKMEVWVDARNGMPQPRILGIADAIVTKSSDNEDEYTSLYNTRIDAKTYIQTGNEIIHNKKVIGVMVDINDASGQDTALAAIGSTDWIYVNHFSTDKMIPAENLISAACDTGTKIAVFVDSHEHVLGFSRALEVGVNALCLPYDADETLCRGATKAREDRENEMAKYDELSLRDNVASPKIADGICHRITRNDNSSGSTTVVADRVCLDFVRSLSSTEGCWIGSSAKIMALVLSEAAESKYVPSRPFRVNAGPVHSYILMGDGCTTKYLSELEPGDEVLVYDAENSVERSVALGRLKIEVRPCILVGLQGDIDDGNHNGMEGQIFLQQAETVRLATKDGSFIRVTDLSDTKEHKILLRTTFSGTHIGKAYTGKVTEK